MSTASVNRRQSRHGRITFQQHPSESDVTHTWLPGNYLFAHILWDILERETPPDFWKAVLASLPTAERAQLRMILEHTSEYEKFAMLVASTTLLETCVRYSPCSQRTVPFGHLLFSFMDCALRSDPVLMLRSIDDVRMIDDHDAARCLMLLYTRIGFTLFINGADRADVALVLDYAAEYVEPFCSDASWTKNAVYVSAMLRSNSVNPVLIAHTNAEVGALDWHGYWCDDWQTMADILSVYAPIEGGVVASMSANISTHLKMSYFDSILDRLTPENRFGVCVAMQRSFGNTFRLRARNSDAVFHVHTHVAGFDTLSEFCATVLG